MSKDWWKQGVGELGAYARGGYRDFVNNVLPAFPETQRTAEEPGMLGVLSSRDQYEKVHGKETARGPEPARERQKEEQLEP